MRIWVTRAEPGASATAERLRALGHDVVVSPLLSVRPIEVAAPDLEGVGALAFSSATGVARFAELVPDRDLPCFAVGDATAAAARAAGFLDVRSADGDVTALARLIVAAQPDGAVLHIGPSEPAGDLTGILVQGGVPARFLAVYETSPMLASPAPEGLDAIVIHSPKAARILAAMTEPRLRTLRILALSEACAAPLREAGFASLQAAASPREEALLELLR